MKIVHVSVTPGAKKEEIIHDGVRLRVKISERAENNMANRRLIEMISEHFGVGKKDVRIIKGIASKEKIVLVDINEAPSKKMPETTHARGKPVKKK